MRLGLGLLRQPHLALVCAISFLSSFKPSEPHLVQYLLDVKGFTEAQVFAGC